MSFSDRSSGRRRTAHAARTALGASALALTLLTTAACGPDNSSADTAVTAGAGAAPNIGLPANLEDLKKWKFDDWEKWAKDYALPAAAKGFWTLDKLLKAKPNEPLPPPPAPPAAPAQPTQAPAQPSQPSQPAKPAQPSQPAQPGQPTAPGAPTAPATTPGKPPAGQPTQPGHPTPPPAPPKPSNTQQPASQAPAQPAQPTQAPAQPAQPPAQPAQPTQAPAQPAQPSQAPAQPAQPAQPADNGNDPLPKTVNAQPLPHPYTKLAVHGKLFADAPGSGAEAAAGRSHYQCSATVVADPAHPGKSNLVWTAGHCIHQGKGGKYFSNISFIPAFNSNGALSGGKQAEEAQYAPLGIWNATQAVTSPQWKAEGGDGGSPATQYDFAIIKVQPGEGGKSLEETVGGAVPVWFNAPREQLSITEYGYPAAPPFDGMELNRCESGRPTRLSYDPTRPPMHAIGCTMTGGSSGGGWLAVKDGKPALVSNVSVGQHTGDPKFQAGPYLDDVAAGAYDFISKKG
ncbi:trypsin-like serine peptidase [Kitasatospora purpeofusca]|uniref:trypsin-like serine peptidase n=1 Tax=Kitasatospora purpeofusca TaxID=67352 RepID=UPI0035DFDD7E